MSYETFEKLIKQLEMFRDRSSKLYNLGVNLMDFEEPYHESFTMMLTEIFGNEGYDWISWYLFERQSHSGEILKAWDKDDNEICFDIPSLWKEMLLIKIENNSK